MTFNLQFLQLAYLAIQPVAGSVPANAIRDENNNPILDENGNYILSE